MSAAGTDVAAVTVAPSVLLTSAEQFVKTRTASATKNVKPAAKSTKKTASHTTKSQTSPSHRHNNTAVECSATTTTNTDAAVNGVESAGTVDLSHSTHSTFSPNTSTATLSPGTNATGATSTSTTAMPTTKVLPGVGATNSSTTSHLHEAALINATTDIEQILQLPGANVDATDSHLCTALHLAASAGHAKTAKLLLQFGANPSRRSLPNGMTPLHYAVESGNVPTVKLLTKTVVAITDPPTHVSSTGEGAGVRGNERSALDGPAAHATPSMAACPLVVPHRVLVCGINVQRQCNGVYTRILPAGFADVGIGHDYTDGRAIYMHTTEDLFIRYISDRKCWMVSALKHVVSTDSEQRARGYVYSRDDAQHPTGVLDWEVHGFSGWELSPLITVTDAVQAPPTYMQVDGLKERVARYNGYYKVQERQHNGRALYKHCTKDMYLRFIVKSKTWMVTDKNSMLANDNLGYVCGKDYDVLYPSLGTTWKVPDTSTSLGWMHLDSVTVCGFELMTQVSPKRICLDGLRKPCDLANGYYTLQPDLYNGHCLYKLASDDRDLYLRYADRCGTWMVSPYENMQENDALGYVQSGQRDLLYPDEATSWMVVHGTEFIVADSVQLRSFDDYTEHVPVALMLNNVTFSGVYAKQLQRCTGAYYLEPELHNHHVCYKHATAEFFLRYVEGSGYMIGIGSGCKKTTTGYMCSTARYPVFPPTEYETGEACWNVYDPAISTWQSQPQIQIHTSFAFAERRAAVRRQARAAAAKHAPRASEAVVRRDGQQLRTTTGTAQVSTMDADFFAAGTDSAIRAIINSAVITAAAAMAAHRHSADADDVANVSFPVSSSAASAMGTVFPQAQTLSLKVKFVEGKGAGGKGGSEQVNLWTANASRADLLAATTIGTRTPVLRLIDAANNDGNTALHLAAMEQNGRLAASLVRGGADLLKKNCVGNIPLHLAAVTNNVSVLKVLLGYQHKASAKPSGQALPSPSQATQQPRLDAVKTRQPHDGPNGTLSNTLDGASVVPMHSDKKRSKRPAIKGKLLFTTGDTADKQNSSGCAPLHAAADNGAGPAIDVLVDAGASMELRDDNGRTPLMRAALGGARCIHAVERLVARGASLFAEDSNNHSVLQLSMVPEVEELLFLRLRDMLLSMIVAPNFAQWKKSCAVHPGGSYLVLAQAFCKTSKWFNNYATDTYDDIDIDVLSKGQTKTTQANAELATVRLLSKAPKALSRIMQLTTSAAATNTDDDTSAAGEDGALACKDDFFAAAAAAGNLQALRILFKITEGYGTVRLSFNFLTQADRRGLFRLRSVKGEVPSRFKTSAKYNSLRRHNTGVLKMVADVMQKLIPDAPAVDSCPEEACRDACVLLLSKHGTDCTAAGVACPCVLNAREPHCTTKSTKCPMVADFQAVLVASSPHQASFAAQCCAAVSGTCDEHEEAYPIFAKSEHASADEAGNTDALGEASQSHGDVACSIATCFADFMPRCGICNDAFSPYWAEGEDTVIAERAVERARHEHYEKPPCLDTFCKSCLSQWVASCLEERSCNIRCPAPACKGTLYVDDVERLGSEAAADTFVKLRSTDYRDRLEELLLEPDQNRVRIVRFLPAS